MSGTKPLSPFPLSFALAGSGATAKRLSGDIKKYKFD
jgi:hypothetical protein